jgi:HEAT repeat protein
MLSPLSGTFTGYLRDASVADAVSRLVGSTPYTAVYAADREPTDRSILVTLRIGGKSLSRADASVLQRAPDELSLVASNATTSEVNARLLNEWQIENFDHDRELNASDPRERMRALDAVYPAGGALVMLDAMLQFDVDPDVRIAAVHKLDESSSMIARASILKSLNDPDPEVVSETVRIIVDWDDEEFIPRYLEPLLAHPDARIREQIADFLEFLE